MNIRETVALDQPVESNEVITEKPDVREQLDMPVPRANAVASILLQRVYSNDEETARDDRAALTGFIDAFVHQKSFSGSADDFHNFVVELARHDEYGLACDVLDAGMRPGYFGRNCDLLADYLEYGVRCGRRKEAKRALRIMMGMPRRKWTWRGFTFAITFLMHLDEQDEFDKSTRAALASVDCASVLDSGWTEEPAWMLALADEFGHYYPAREEVYYVTSQVYAHLRDEAKALNVLSQAEETLPHCPKCSFRRANILFERGEYVEACQSVQRALEGATETQSRINIGYLHYLCGLCYVASTGKDDQPWTDELADTVYTHFESALVEFEGGREDYQKIIRRNTRDVRNASHRELGEDYPNLLALVEEG